MNGSLSSDKIRIKQTYPAGHLPKGQCESVLTLTQKLHELFSGGSLSDDIYGMVIPLLMQGKVRLDLENHSERLELEDQNHRQIRSEAVRIYEQYLRAYGHNDPGEGPHHEASPAETQRVFIRRMEG